MISEHIQMPLKVKMNGRIILFGLILSLVLCYSALFLEYRYIFTLEYFVSQSVSYADAYEWYRQELSIIWLNVVGVLAIILGRTLVISWILYTSHKVANVSVRFDQEFAIASIATIIFGLNYLVTVIGKVTGLISYSPETVNNNYRYQSVNVFFDSCISLSCLKGPLDLLNISQVVSLVILVVFSLIILNSKTYKSKLKILVSTLIGYMTFLFLIINAFILTNLFQYYA
ncbi:hypothetical protein [Porphyromonas somerae]|uniref:hypothetical protein n=1 Tax=Porphyromonas somerae TaxID=322095 RepID=UPI002A821AAD|nr:hypothetical protein [Porphyromonas somerae]MDY3884875.1 hypothetical protein [Porphyromonas somerae]